MRATEYIDWLTRTDIGIAANPPAKKDYSHLLLTNRVKRARYLYQCKLQGKTPTK